MTNPDKDVCDAFDEELKKSPSKIFEQMKNYGPGKDIEESIKSLKSAKEPTEEEKKAEADPHMKDDL